MGRNLKTIAKLREWLDPNGRRSKDSSDWLDLKPRLVCKDGFSMSVQASRTHYCAPRNNEGPWTSVEIGYPSTRVEAFMPFIDGKDSDPTDTVYGYVPIGIVANVVMRHGGIA